MAIIQKTIQTAKFKYWKGIIEDRIQSGLSIDEYCKKNSLSRNAYFYWLRKVRTYIIELGNEHSIVEIPSQESPLIADPPAVAIENPEKDKPAEKSSLDIYIGKAKISVNENTSDALLRKVIKVFQDA